MAVLVPVDDPADPRVSDFVGLADPDLRRLRERSGGSEGGFFIAEGVRVIRQLVCSPYRVRSLLLAPRRLAALEAELATLDAPVFVAAQPVLDSISAFHLHRGALASADRRALPGLAAVTGADGPLVLAEGVNDHENLGALFRNAAAFGAAAVVLDPTCADPLYRRSVRVSLGHVLRVPFTVARPWPAAVAQLQACGFEVLALTPAPDAEDLRGVERRRRQALLVG
ncbi:MAG: RNA methyltransferase, partial [Actinomycetota bacterium]|nr:RNA methyltransferase [Actinomycetota bacterium]